MAALRANVSAADSLPWSGHIMLPVQGVNHAYRPLLIKRADGHMGATIGKTAAIKVWAIQEGYSLVAQNIPTLRPTDLVTACLTVTIPEDRYDADSYIKLTLDLLATYLGRVHPDTPARTRKGRTVYAMWNDLRVRRMVVDKRIDKTRPGIDVTIERYVEEGAA